MFSSGSKRNVKELDAAALKDYALRVLAGRALSASELRAKLERRAERAEDVPAVLAQLKEYGYLDDARFAESFATARRDNQGLGRSRVLRDLRARRVAPAVAQDAVSEAFEGVDEIQQIEQYLARRYRNIKLGEFLREDKNLASAFRRLRYAGFSAGNSIRVLKRYSASADALEETAEPEE